MGYVFPRGCDMRQLLDCLRWHHWWGQITGPHGTGKTTLLESLLEPLGQAGRCIHRFTLHQGQRRLPLARGEDRRWTASTQIIVDGYEQLTVWSRHWLTHCCRRQGCGLLVTAHRSAGLPPLWETRVTAAAAQQIVSGLLGEDRTFIREEQLAQLLDHHNGNLRDTLFALYDLFEQRR